MKGKKKIVLISVVTALMIAILLLDCGNFERKAAVDPSKYFIMIDPGHGGMDGGAVSMDGTLEKDINLAIAGKLAVETERYGCSSMLTRETDQWLCSTEEGSIRARKTADLKARREMIRKYSPDVTVSIHLNSFTEDASVNGAQVFYPSTGGDEQNLQQCRELAEILQDNLNRTLQQEHPRNAMIRDGVFIFKEVEQPVVIIECGFLSNPAEAEQLKTSDYQEKLAECIMTGIAEFAHLELPDDIELIDSIDAQQSLEITGFIDSLR